METRAEKAGEPSGRIVKRYANRKLYDTRESRYVTLEQIADLVRAGEDVRIIDNRTKEDLTDVTLAQIIYEEQREGKKTAWSVRTLRELVREGGDRLLTTLKESPVAKLVQRESARPEEPLVEPPVPEPTASSGPAEEETSAAAKLLARSREALEDLGRTADDRVKGVVQSAVTHFRELQAEVKRLQARVSELEEKLVRATRRGPRSDPPDGDSPG